MALQQVQKLSTTQANRILLWNTHKIRRTINFPSYLINELKPFLKNKYSITKQQTRKQQALHSSLLSYVNSIENDLIIECQHQDIIEDIDDTVRYIQHHSIFFNTAKSTNISPNPRPAISVFRRNKKYNSDIKKLAMKYKCHLWYLESDNKFGLFSESNYNIISCMQDIRIYIENTKVHMDYIQCDEVYKTFYFRFSNPAFLKLIEHCNGKYGENTYCIEQRFCDRGFLWIWSENEECRKYIKNSIEYDIEHKWIHKYVHIEDHQLSILFGAPYNYNKDIGKRINMFLRLFGYDDEAKMHRFIDDDGNECLFDYKCILEPNSKTKDISIVINGDQFENMAIAKRFIQQISDRIRNCDNSCIECDVGKPYLHVLSGCYMDQISNDILYAEIEDKLLVTYDNIQSFDEFKAMIYDHIIPNTIVVNGFECFGEAHIFERLIKNLVTDLKFIQNIQNVDNDMFTYTVTIHDDRLNDMEYRQKMMDIIQYVRDTQIQTYRVSDNTYFYIIYGWHAKQMHALKKHCNLECLGEGMMQRTMKNNTMYIGGLDKTDERLNTLLSLFDVIISNCDTLKLSPNEWQFLRCNKSWNIRQLAKLFKCCLALDDGGHCDTLLLYASETDKISILEKIRNLSLC